MAATMSSSSSEDEDEKQRLREAVFDVAACTEPDSSSRRDKKGKGGSLKRSLREVQKEDEEAYSTGISGEVRDFVAKKLSSFLDSCITDMDNNTEMGKVTDDEERDCGFRIFSSSDPGTEVNLTGVRPQVRRRKQVESSSGDSDSEEEKVRLAEAAVTHQAILQASAPLQVANTPGRSCSDSASTQEKVASNSTNTVSNNPSNQAGPKKKKKKRKRKEESIQRTEDTRKSVDNVDDSEQRPRKKKKSKLESKDLSAEKLTPRQSEKGQQNGCSTEESKVAAHSLLSEKHLKKKKKRKKILDDS
ncbi:uncharacterized protein LOC144916147 [Branchiostoma floridae x Branchiostoma belcheri]